MSACAVHIVHMLCVRLNESCVRIRLFIYLPVSYTYISKWSPFEMYAITMPINMKNIFLKINRRYSTIVQFKWFPSLLSSNCPILLWAWSVHRHHDYDDFYFHSQIKISKHRERNHLLKANH